MSNKIGNIQTDEIKLNEDGTIELSEELQNAVAGGVSPEDTEEEGTNVGCINFGCKVEKLEDVQ